MPNETWERAMTQLAAAQRDFINGDATAQQQLYSHRDDVTVMGALAASNVAGPKWGHSSLGRPRTFTAAITISKTSALPSARTLPVSCAWNTGRAMLQTASRHQRWNCASPRRSGLRATDGASSTATPTSSYQSANLGEAAVPCCQRASARICCRRNALPGRLPLDWPSAHTGTPLTKTCSMPAAAIVGFSKVARSITVAGSKTVMSA